MINPDALHDKISRLSTIPALSPVAAHIIQRIFLPETTARSLATLISQDVGLSAKILRLANSPFYGIPRTVSNLHDAIVILGFNTIYTIVISVSVFDVFRKSKLSVQFDPRVFWTHSILCAFLCKKIAAAVPKVNSEDAFCMGLLHDIGKVVMDHYLHDDLLKAIDYASLTGCTSYLAEKTVLGYTHTDVNQWLISTWNLPERLYIPLVNHHNPERYLETINIKNSPLEVMHLCICHIADYLSYEGQFSSFLKMSTTPPTLNPKCCTTIGLTTLFLEDILEQVRQEWEKMNIFYSLLHK